MKELSKGEIYRENQYKKVYDDALRGGDLAQRL